MDFSLQGGVRDAEGRHVEPSHAGEEDLHAVPDSHLDGSDLAARAQHPEHPQRLRGGRDEGVDGKGIGAGGGQGRHGSVERG